MIATILNNLRCKRQPYLDCVLGTSLTIGSIKKQRWKARTVFTFMLLLSATAVMFLAATWTLFPAAKPPKPTNPFDLGTQTCSRPPTRREWRSLTTREKNDYISAAMCLYTTRSQLKGEGSLLDHLTLVHIMQDCRCNSSYFLLPRSSKSY